MTPINKYTLFDRLKEETYYKLKYFLQRVFKGYDDLDVWNPNNFIAKKSLIILKAHKQHKRHGYPANLTEQEWEKILDEMIEGFEEYYKYEILLGHKETLEELIKKEKETYNKVTKSLDLLNKYFYNLWD